ncbi:MAG: hypothetical protein KKB95_09355 [Gammaproteobacteria bacterium]|nr:hypothetical protein [Gammaproteobacteria bacterium]MBU1505768.1 hypothetical protein [Gammaproteobacteria bacterium]MBU2119456.1 hypothetical protein [Gammaproteobacteria bacterium]MBU2172638.1 hypothetical protein [Gammaproteobacteria bacterium]MBU2202096.1 hypothetical protein [Gammaproteobacteria bacterium]
MESFWTVVLTSSVTGSLMSLLVKGLLDHWSQKGDAKAVAQEVARAFEKHARECSNEVDRTTQAMYEHYAENKDLPDDLGNTPVYVRPMVNWRLLGRAEVEELFAFETFLESKEQALAVIWGREYVSPDEFFDLLPAALSLEGKRALELAEKLRKSWKLPLDTAARENGGARETFVNELDRIAGNDLWRDVMKMFNMNPHQQANT